MATAVTLSGGSTLHCVTDNQKRWLVFGIALNKILVTQIRFFAEREVQREYGNLQTSHNIHTQSTSGRLKNWPTFLKYENINGNDVFPRLPGGRFNYSLFDCRVTSHVDFAKLYVENHMAKFNAFDEHCDASAVLTLLGKVPVFSPAVQSAANDVRQARNSWAHCVFSEWDPVNYQHSFNKMETLVKALALPPIIERNLLGEMKDWESKGTILCMNATVDADLLKLVQQHVNALNTDVGKLTFEVQEDKKRVSQALKYISTSLEELRARVASVQHEQEVMKQEQSSLSDKMDSLETDMDSTHEQLKSLKCQQEDVQQRVAHVEEKLNSAFENREDCSHEGAADVVNQQNESKVSVEIAGCESDIAFFAKRRHPDTRQWFFDDFDEWFRDPGDCRAYVLLGDPGVGKSVMAGVMAQRMRKAGHLGAAYFCRHNNGTRNDPRYLLGTVACQLCDCNTQYKVTVGGESGVKMLLGNSKLRIQELFTKLLDEPLSKCFPCDQRKVVIIDALDETEYESREDFLDLIMHRFPLLPEWLVFFITSRPEDSVQFTLKKYNPCVKICAGNSDQDNFYQQHEQDIQTFLKNKIDFSRLSVTVEDISKKCNGLFLYAHYTVEELRLSGNSGKELNQLSDLFPGDIEDFFLQNLKRVHDQVGQDIFKRFFGCAIVAPAPLPVSIIPCILKREKSNCDEQQVIDAVSQFVVLRTSDQTLTFLHNLIPAWLTDKRKASRKLFIDKKIAGEYLRTIFVEILSSIVNGSRPTWLSTDADLEDYISCVAVRFLCQNGAKDSLMAVFDCLTSYHFVETKIQSGRIEIYHLLDDLRLAAGRLPVEEVWKQEVLQEILSALENNVLVLSECPHILHSCLRNASNAVRETVLIPRMSTPWFEWIVVAFPNVTIADMDCFSTSPDGKTVVGAKLSCLLLFDVSTVEKVGGPFYLDKYTTGINHLEFSPDGKFIFFGRLDKWFSVERSCVEDFPQFSGNSQIYKWGVFANQAQCIVVKRPYLYNPATSICKAQNCLFKLLALWAVKEIEQSRDYEMTVSFELESGMLNECFSKRLKVKNKKYVVQTCEALDVCNPTCVYCSRLKELTQSNQEPSLATVRQLVIELYPFIFDYQIWDFQTGMPVLQKVFSQDIQLNPFIYLCHVTCAFGNLVGCCGIEKAMSVCNIAMINAFFGYENFCFKYELELKLESRSDVNFVRRSHRLDEEYSPLLRQLKVFGDLTQELRQERKLLLKLQLEQKEEFLERVMDGRWHPETCIVLMGMQRFQLKMDHKRSWERLMSAVFEEFHNEAFKFGIWTKTRKGFQRLVYDLNEENGICVSPHDEWKEVGYLLKFGRDFLIATDAHFVHHGNPEHIISKFTHFSLTNDGLYFVYSCDCSLQALSLQTGRVFTSVSGFDLIYFPRERQVGYLFRRGTDERTIFLTNLCSPFKLFPRTNASFVGKSMGAMFRSSNTLVSISSDSTITSWETMASKKRIPCICGSLLTEPGVQSRPLKKSLFSSMFRSGVTVQSISSDSIITIPLIRKSLLVEPGVQSPPVKNCLLSSDGRLIAIHQKTKVELYSFEDNAGEKKFLHTVHKSKCEFTVPCFAFSADSTLLLFCIQDSRRFPHLFVWDIQQKVMAASLKSPGLLTIECCCFSWDKRLLILCGDYEIEIVEYAEDTCRRLGVERPYHSVKFAQCTVSLDNQLMVCCIANRILIYNLLAPNVNSSKQVLRGHLGRIEFCRFLKANHYLISYGVDGMVFLWEISELKAVAFVRITQGNEKIVAMAVSPEEDLAVCFISSDRICMIKLCGLGVASSFKPLTSPSKEKLETAESSLRIPRQIASTSAEDDMAAESSSSSDTEEDMNDYYQEHDDDVYLM